MRLFLSLIFSLGLINLSYAADLSAKEITTPPPAEGAITIEQVQPLDTASKLNPPVAAKPAAADAEKK